MWEAILGAVLGGSGVVAVLAPVLQHLAAKRKAIADNETLKRQELAADYDRHISRLERRVDQLEKDHDDCQRENAALREQVGKLQEAVVRLEKQLSMQGRGGV